MPRARRQFIANQPYELCFRAKSGLPLPPNDVINLIIESGLARANRDHKVIICSFLWMGNHPHLIVVSRDAEKLKLFYTELQKYLTEAIKRLLGLDLLLLWEGRPMVALVGDIESAVERTA